MNMNTTKKLFILGAATLLFAVSFLSPQQARAAATCESLLAGNPDNSPEGTIAFRQGYAGSFSNSDQNPDRIYNISVASGTLLQAEYYSYAEPNSTVFESWPNPSGQTITQQYNGPCGYFCGSQPGQGRLHPSSAVRVVSPVTFGIGMTQFCIGPGEPPSGSVTVNVSIIPDAPTVYTLEVRKHSAGTGTGTVTGNPAGNGGDDINCDLNNLNCSAPFNSGSVVALTPMPATGSVFAGWSGCQTTQTPNISVTMNSNKTCTARFNLINTPPPCVSSIGVTSNLPTTWNLTGPQSFSQTTPGITATYSASSEPEDYGTYTLVPGALTGYSYAVTPAASQSISACGGGLSYVVTYLPRQSPSCSLTSGSQTYTGQPVSFTGVIPNVSQPYSWQATGGNPSSANSVNPFVTTYSSPGLKTVSITQSSSSPDPGECTVNITDPPNSPNPTLRMVPNYDAIEVNESSYFRAKYDADGSGSQAEQDVTINAVWASANPSKASYQGLVGTTARFRGVSEGTASIRATHAGLTATGTIVVSQAVPDLSVLLVANPDQGTATFNSNLTASVAGTAQGTINYTFWKDCNYGGTSILGATNQCGQYDCKFDGVSTNPQSCGVQYSVPKNPATGFVIVERGNHAANAGVAVIVRSSTTTPPTTHLACVSNSCAIVDGGGANQDGCLVAGSTCGIVNPPTHSECVSSACQSVSGPGPDRCDTSSDCGGGSGQSHSVCDAVQQACVNVSGPGTSTCGSDPACLGTWQSHLECQNDSCVIVGGAGTNTCTTVGSSCTVIPPTGGTCSFTADPTLIPRGNSSVLSWSCNGTLNSCAVRDTLNNPTLNGSSLFSGGASGSISANPATTTSYSLNCNSGAFTGSVTVRVLTITEVPPR
jgi:hypothetical protein